MFGGATAITGFYVETLKPTQAKSPIGPRAADDNRRDKKSEWSAE